MIRTASGLILRYMKAFGFQGWTSFWGVIYMAPGYELHQGLIRHERKHLEQMERDGIPPGAREWEIALQVSEAEATAWSWAAGKAAGLPDAEIIEDWCFNDEGALTRTMLASRSHYGINGLAHAGFCRTSNSDRRVGVVYPALNFWLQP